MAREVGSIIVGVVVGYFAGPQAGFAAAALVYGATAPNTKTQGPRLTDLQAPQANYGGVIPYIEGAPRTAGTYVWYSEKREVANESSTGGKGGPGVDNTLFTYEMDALILFSINELAGIRRVWSNGRLVWSKADNADGQTLQASVNVKDWRALRFYSGESTQLPDPTYEASVGIGNAPAYRGRASVFIEGLNLGQSGQLPVLTFEVVSKSTGGYSAVNLGTVSAAVAGQPRVGTCNFDPNGAAIHLPIFVDLLHSGEVAVKILQDGIEQPTVAGSGYSINSDGNIAAIDDLSGTTDVSCYAFHDPSLGAKHVGIRDGVGLAVFDLGLSATTRNNFARKGNDVVFGTSGSGDKKIYRAASAGGSLIASSVAMTNDVRSLAISDDGYVYAVNTVGSAIYKLSLTTLALVETITPPVDGSVVFDACCDRSVLYLLSAFNLWRRDGAVWVAAMANLPPRLRIIDSSETNLAVRNGSFYRLFHEIGPVPATYTIVAGLPTLTQPSIPLDQVVSRICVRTGLLTTADIDVTALAGDNVRAFAVTQVGPARQALEILMATYLFEAAESSKIKFVKRGGAPVLTIPYTDLGASNGQVVEPLPLVHRNDLEVAARVTIKYANMLNDFQSGAETGDRLVTQSTAVNVVDLAIGLTPTEAKRIADAQTMDLAVSLIGIGPVSIGRKYARVEPTDVIVLTKKDGSTFRARVQKLTSANSVNTLELVLDDATVINSVASGDDKDQSSNLIRVVQPTTLLLLDIPILRDTDNAPGIYAAVNSNTPWPGTTLYRSGDNISYVKSISSATRAVTGTATTLLGNWPGGAVFDEVNSVTVNVGEGQLASVTRDVLLSTNNNALLVGREIVQFRSALLIGAGVYTVSGLLRGRRGTEWAVAAHAIGERVVLLQTTTLKRIAESAADIGTPVYWKAVTIGKTLAGTQSQAFTDTGVALKPFAPVDLRKAGDDSSVVVTWKRRSRLATRFTGSAGISVPLGEASESYTVELRNASNVLVSTETVALPQWTGTSATITDGLQTVVWGLQTIGGDLVGIQDDNINRQVGVRYLVRMDTAGLVIGLSPSLGNQVYQWANSGDELYAATADLSPGPGPSAYLNGKVQRVTRTAIGAIAATYTAATPGDVAGVACDGTNVWMTERYGGKLRKLDATTLASVITYTLSTGIGALYYDSGSLWICSGDTNQIIQWNIAGAVETQRFSCVTAPFDLLIVGALIFVQGATSVGVYTKSTGILVNTIALTAPIYLAQHALCLFGNYVAFGGLYVVKLLNSSTGLLSRSLETGRPYAAYIAAIDPHGPAVDPQNTFFFAVSGAYSAKLFLSVGNQGRSTATLAYQLAAPALAGYTIAVAQNGAAGRGYTTSLTL